MSKYLICLVGESGCGKSSIADCLRIDHGMRELLSYTTRLPRYKYEKTHSFINDEEYNKLKNIVAYTEFDGNKYCCTAEQIESSDFYVVDPDGVKTLKENYKGKKNIFVVYIKVSKIKRFLRTIKRGDSFKDALRRIKHDKSKFADAQAIADIIVSNKNVERCADEILEKFYEMILEKVMPAHEV